MLCFRCGSPVEQEQAVCSNCGESLAEGASLDFDSFAEIQRQLPRGEVAGQGAYRPGDVVLHRYEVLDVVGSGPVGVVYKALDLDVDVDVALKVIGSEHLRDAEARRRVAASLSELRRVAHDNMVRYFDVGVDGERCFYVTQFLEGLSLRKIADMRREKGQRFALSEVEPICLQLCDALESTDLVHGGLKPENVIILPDLLKLTDPALARALPRQAFLAAHKASGQLGYLAPEIVAGEPVTPAADVYSLATIIVELLRGELGQSAETLVDFEEIPDSLIHLLAWAQSEESDERPANAGAFGRLFSAAARGEEVAPGARAERRRTLRFGGVGMLPTPMSVDGESAGAANLTRDTVAYAEASEQERMTQRVPAGGVPAPDERETVQIPQALPPEEAATEVAPSARSLSPAAGVLASTAAPKEVTQQLSVDELEVVDDAVEGLSLRGGEARVAEGKSAPRDVRAEQPAASRERTQQLALDDLEFATADEGAAQGARADDSTRGEAEPDESEATVRRSARELADVLPEDDEQDDLLLGVAPAKANTRGEGRLRLGEEGAAPASSGSAETLEFVPVAGESSIRTESYGQNRAAISGETNSSVRPMPLESDSEDLVLPHRQRRTTRQEARAREVLQAFDTGTTDGSGGSSDLGATSDDELIEPADAPLMRPSGRRASGRTPLPRAGSADGLDATTLDEEPLPPPNASPAVVPSWVVGAVIGLAAGVLGAVFFIMAGESTGGSAAAPKASPPRVGGVAADLPASTPMPQVVPLASPLPRSAGDASRLGASDASVPTQVDQGAGAASARQATKVDPGKVDPGKVDPGKVDPGKVDPGKVNPGKVNPGGRPRGTAQKAAGKAGDVARGSRERKAGSRKRASGGQSKACYPRMAHIKVRGGEGYCIDRYEAPGAGSLPKRVSLAAARAGCAARGFRLCTAREWRRGCGGRFPYGSSYRAGRCNTGSKGLVASGSLSRCRSAAGLYDMAGNAAEWVESGAALGGDFGAAQAKVGCSAPSLRPASAGYRCCSDPAWE